MDRFIVGENSTGKTRKMLELAKETNAIVVCKNKDSMLRKCRDYGIFGLNVIGYNDIQEIPEGSKIAIDEISEFFNYYFSVNLDAFTATVD